MNNDPRPSILIRRTFLGSLAFCVLMGTHISTSATLHVPGTYATISLAITAASSGDTIIVAAGTYTEHLNISKSIVIIGAGSANTTVDAPADFLTNTAYRYNNDPTLFNPRAALVRIAPGMTAVFRGFTVDGTNPDRDTSSVAFTGILVEQATATIAQNTVKNFLPSDTSGVVSTSFSGRGIEILGGSGESKIDSNTISECQRFHILVSATDDKTVTPGAFPKAHVRGNTITGLGQSKLAQKGIWYNWGAYGSISDNVISGFDYTSAAVEPDRASAIVNRHGEYRTGGKSRLKISGNTLSASTSVNNKGIFLEGNADTVMGNVISGFRWNIQVDDNDSTYVIGNTITGGTIGVLVTATTGDKTIPRLVTIGGSPENKNIITGQPTVSGGGGAIQLSFREEFGDGEFLSPIPVVATYNDFGVYADSEVAERIFDRADTTFVTPIDTVHYSPFYTPKLRASVKVFLEGPYDAVGDSMMHTLGSTGTLSGHFTGAPIPALAVDSITIELRNAASAAGSTIQQFAPAWLLTDGTIRAFSDTTLSYVEFDTTISGSYYLVVHHRNHLNVMSSVTHNVDGDTSPAGYDFSDAGSKAYGLVPLKAVGTRYAMIGGDANADGGTDAIDRNAVWRIQNGTSGYLGGDFNLDGGVDAIDLNAVWRENNGSGTQVP